MGLTNPVGAHKTTSDFRNGVSDFGEPQLYQRNALFRANATITKGQALMDVAPTATVPFSVTPMTAAVAASDSWAFVGAALESAAAGDLVNVLVEGYGVLLLEDADTAAFRNVLRLPDTTTGAFATSADPLAGEAVCGKVLGPEIGTTNTAFCYLGFVVVEWVVNT